MNKDNYANAYENWTVRTGLKFQFSDAVSVLLRYSHTKQNDPTPVQTNSNTDTSIDPTTGKPWGIQTFTPPGYYTTNPNQVAANLPTYDIPTPIIETMTVKADLGFANFTSLSQYREEITQQSTNLDQTALARIFQLAWTSDLRLYDQPGIPTDLQTRSAPAMDGGPLLLELPRYVFHLH